RHSSRPQTPSAGHGRDGSEDIRLQNRPRTCANKCRRWSAGCALRAAPGRAAEPGAIPRRAAEASGSVSDLLPGPEFLSAAGMSRPARARSRTRKEWPEPKPDTQSILYAFQNACTVKPPLPVADGG